MKKYVKYDPANGQILHQGTVQDEVFETMSDVIEPNMAAPVINISSKQYYVLNGDVVERPEMSCSVDKVTVVADGSDFITISGMPDPAKVLYGGSSLGEIAGGEVEVTFDVSGQHVVKIVAFPYRDYEVIINATEN